MFDKQSFEKIVKVVKLVILSLCQKSKESWESVYQFSQTFIKVSLADVDKLCSICCGNTRQICDNAESEAVQKRTHLVDLQKSYKMSASVCLQNYASI